jgi:hypothetical protein
MDHSDQLILFERPFDLLATGSLRATIGLIDEPNTVIVTRIQEQKYILQFIKNTISFSNLRH